MIRFEKRFKSCIATLMIGLFAVSMNPSLASAKNVKAVITDPSKPINVDGGKVTGLSSTDGKISIYKSIPFAAPPVGELRWKAPQPVVAWSGIKQCIKYSNYAFQRPMAPMGPYTAEFRPDTDTVPSEDCLYLNVWTKKDSTEKRPVIVYIHGGGNTSGASGIFAYEGENIARKDAVFVSFNYRLGIFGFMAHPELSAESPDKVSGNYAILDQIAALKWVQRNIAKFGGDPNNVTISGQSAGSMDVQYLMLSPLAKGLFKNAVTMSANSINENMQKLSEKEADTVKQFSGKTLKDLRAMSADDLLKISYSSNIVLDNKVFKTNILDAYKAGTMNDVNLITGMVTQDASLFPFVPKVNNGGHFYDAFTSISKEDYTANVKKAFGDLGDKALAVYPAKSFECIDQYNEINSDYMMAMQNFVGKARTVKSTKATYIYKYLHLMPGPDAAINGVFHTSDVPIWFNNFSPVKADYWCGMDRKIGDRMSSYIINFAKTGNPNGAGLTEWNTYNNKEISYMTLNDTFSKVTFSPEKYNFWQEYFKTLGL